MSLNIKIKIDELQHFTSTESKFMLLSDLEIASILKQVQRQRLVKQEEIKWQKFLKAKNFTEKKFLLGSFSPIVKKCVIEHDQNKSESFYSSLSSSENDVIPKKSGMVFPKSNSLSKRHLIFHQMLDCYHHWPYKEDFTYSIDNDETPFKNRQKLEKQKCNVEVNTTLENKNIQAEIQVNKTEEIKVSSSIKNELANDQKLLIDIGDTRIEDLNVRIVSILKNISALLKHDNELNSEEELCRLRKRATEFLTRFTRNYNYQFKRQVDEIEKMLFNSTEAPRRVEKVFQKCLSSFQIAIQALQALEKHLSVGFVDGTPLPVTEFLISLSYLSTIVKKVCTKSLEEYDNMGSLCRSLVSTINQIKKVTKVRKSETSKHNTLVNKKDSLWMYSANIKENNWKTKSIALAMSKFGPPSTSTNQKISIFTHNRKKLSKKQQKVNINSPKDIQQAVPNSENLKQMSKPSSASIANKVHMEGKCPKTDKDSDHNQPINEISRNGTRGVLEEHVKTMMEIIPPDYTNTNLVLEDIKTSLPELMHVKTPQTLKKIVQKKLSTNYDEACHFLHLAVNEMTGILDCLKTNNIFFTEEKQSKHLSGQKETKCGENVKLIFMKEEGLKKKDGRGKIVGCYEIDVKGIKNIHVINHKEAAAQDYVHTFFTYRKSSPFYKSQNGIEPWDFITRVGDKLLLKLTQEISHELEASALVKQMYDSEFKDDMHCMI